MILNLSLLLLQCGWWQLSESWDMDKNPFLPNKVNFLFLDKEARFPQPAYLLSEIPKGKDTSTEAIKEWRTTTKWIAGCLIKLSNYSD